MTSQTKTNLKRTAKAILAVAIVTSIWKALTSYSGQLDLANVNAKLLTAALGITLAYRLTNACGWSFVLRALHVRLPGWTALRIWITSEACRWLPGSVWSYGSRALQAKKQGVPRSLSSLRICFARFQSTKFRWGRLVSSVWLAC